MENITSYQIDSIIRVYNGWLHKNAQYKSPKNRLAAEMYLKEAKDFTEARDFLVTRARNKEGRMDTCDLWLNDAITALKVKHAEEKAPQGADGLFVPFEEPAPVVQKEVPKMSKELEQGLDVLGKIVAETLSKVHMEDIAEPLRKSFKADIDKYIADTYGPIERRTDLIIDGTKIEIEGVTHKKFMTILKFVANHEPVFMVGPAGTGKTTIGKQIADALHRDFYFSNAVTQEYQIKGFTDAKGEYQESQFYKAFKNGGVFLIDEIDGSIPEALILLNSAIANGYFDFPAPIGRVDASPNFAILAAGNTFGLGADYEYVGRNQLDAASLDRFAIVEIDYDPDIEKAMARGDEELLGFCRAFRKAATKAGIKTIVSYRAISRMSKLSKLLEAKELLKSCLTKALTPQDLEIIADQCAGWGEYSSALKSMAHA